MFLCTYGDINPIYFSESQLYILFIEEVTLEDFFEE